MSDSERDSRENQLELVDLQDCGLTRYSIAAQLRVPSYYKTRDGAKRTLSISHIHNLAAKAWKTISELTQDVINQFGPMNDDELWENATKTYLAELPMHSAEQEVDKIALSIDMPPPFISVFLKTLSKGGEAAFQNFLPNNFTKERDILTDKYTCHLQSAEPRVHYIGAFHFKSSPQTSRDGGNGSVSNLQFTLALVLDSASDRYLTEEQVQTFQAGLSPHVETVLSNGNFTSDLKSFRQTGEVSGYLRDHLRDMAIQHAKTYIGVSASQLSKVNHQVVLTHADFLRADATEDGDQGAVNQS